MKCLFLTKLVLFLAVAGANSPRAFCQGQNSFAYLGTAAYELAISNDHTEPFFLGDARDRWEKKVTVFGRTNPAFFATQVALSEVYAAVGLDHVPVYPTFATTQKPMWEPESLEELHQKWFVAAVSPQLAEMESPPKSHSEISWETVERRALMAWMDVAFMARGRSEKWVEGVPLSTSPTEIDIFRYTKQPTHHELHQKFLSGDKFPWQRLASASPEEVHSLTLKVKALLDRLDAVLSNHFEELLGPLIAYALPEGVSSAGAVRATNLVKRALSNLRPFVQWHLSTKIGKSFVRADVAQPGPLPRLLVPKALFLGVSSYWPVLNDVQFVISHANALLYAYAMSPPWKQAWALARWQREMGTKNPLQLLVNVAAARDGSTRWIAHAIPGPSPEANAVPLQLALNERARNGVLAFSGADAEGQEILKAAQTLAPRLKILPLHIDFRNGTKLAESDIETLFQVAKTKGSAYVAICELGGIPAGVSRGFAERNRLWAPGGNSNEAFRFDENDPALVVFDHHQTEQSSWRHSSSLELLSQFTGFQMSINQIGTAILDRSGVSGLLELGMSKQEVTEYLAYRSNSKRLAALERRAEQIYLGPNVLHWIADPEAKFSDVSKGMGLAAYPNMAHFALVNGKNLIVRSTPSVIQSLRALPSISALHTVFGGDGRRSSYLIIPFHQPGQKPSSNGTETWRKDIAASAQANGISCPEELLKW